MRSIALAFSRAVALSIAVAPSLAGTTAFAMTTSFAAAATHAPDAAAAAVHDVPQQLVAAMMGDEQLASCVRDSGRPARAYVASAFDVRRVVLRGGEQMTVLSATDDCMFRGQSARIAIFERSARGYRRVLDDFTIPGLAAVGSDGSAVLPTHDSIDTIVESAYLWNGDRYVFSSAASHVYDVPLGQRRPYEIAVRFAAGSSGTTLTGTVARNFGDRYVFRARSGQTIVLRRAGSEPCRADVAVFFGDVEIALLADRPWRGTLAHTGTYDLIVDGSGACEENAPSSYALSLTIR